MNRTIFGATDEFNFPYIDIGLSNDAGVRVKAKAIIDTGAAHCLVQPELIQQLNLEPFQTSTYIHPQNGVQPTGYYKLSVFFDLGSEEPICISNVVFGEIRTPNFPAGAIIGLNFLKYCSFRYDGKECKFEIDLKF